MASAITGIRLNRATFRDVRIDQLSCVNFFYGNNGAGKSSIARAIEENDGLEWRDGALPSNYDILVFNQDFISRNFSDCGSLPGVFTVNETNVKIQGEVAEKTAQRGRLEAQREAALAERQEKSGAPAALLTEFQNACWTKTAALRAGFDRALEGKRQKKSLAGAVLGEETPREHDLAALKSLCDAAFDASSRTYPQFVRVDKAPSYGKMPGKDLLNQVVASRGETPFARFITALNASDWVREGHTHFTGAAKGRCPYCQQELPPDFEQEVAACFDRQYQQDVNDLRQFQSRYSAETDEIIRRLRANMTDVMPTIDLADYQEKLAVLEGRFEVNRRRIAEKVDRPARVVALEDTDSLLLEIGGMIDAINRKVRTNNAVVSQRRTSKENCKKWIVEHLAFVLAPEAEAYRAALARSAKELREAGDREERYRDAAAQLDREIALLNSQTVNTQAAMAGINQTLRNSGFQGFRLRERPDAPNTYEIVRDGNGEIARGLSEGERSFIAFLYFYHMTRGSMNKGRAREKIAVIDDPVSGLDSAALAVVGRIVRDMAGACLNRTGGPVKQLFILTHNVYFHQEITYRQTGCYDRVSFYMIRKSGNRSSVKLCQRQSAAGGMENYNPVQSSYAALWDELREVTSVIPAVNVMRRILESYFLRLCGYDGGELRELVLRKLKYDKVMIPTGDGQRLAYLIASSLLASPSGMDGGASLVEEDGGADAYKRVFKLIFEALGHRQHYDMMAGTGAREGAAYV